MTSAIITFTINYAYEPGEPEFKPEDADIRNHMPELNAWFASQKKNWVGTSSPVVGAFNTLMDDVIDQLPTKTRLDDLKVNIIDVSLDTTNMAVIRVNAEMNEFTLEAIVGMSLLHEIIRILKEMAPDTYHEGEIGCITIGDATYYVNAESIDYA